MSHLDPIPEQTEDVRGRPIAWVGIGTVITILACAATVGILSSLQCSGGGESHVVQLEMMPPATDLHGPTPLELRRAAQLRALDQWSWANRTTGRVRMPIDLAIDRYLRERGAR